MAKIFVSIASYRDPELLPTLRNLLQNATFPENLTICIAWQHAEEDVWDTLETYKNDSRIKIVDIPYKEAKGVCYARHEIQKYYTNEEYYLQLDSHHRFDSGWDVTLMDWLNYLRCKSIKKPVLTTYLPGYDPEKEPQGRTVEVWSLNIDRFMPAGVPFLRPFVVDNWKNLNEPVPTRFISGHFIFTIGNFVKEVPYDPSLYFHGEETSLAGRAFTNGYDLFAPHKPIIWHEYTRKGKARHWDDSKEWSEQDKASYTRFRKIFGMDPGGCTPCQRKALGVYGLGTARTLEDFERFTGLKFSTRQIHQETLDNKLPPIKGDYESGLATKHKVCIDLFKESVPEKDYDNVAVALLDENSNDLYRQDLTKSEFYALFNSEPDDRFMHIWREYESITRPTKWRVWPHSEAKGWCEKIEQNIGYE